MAKLPWFRMYTEAATDPKLGILTDPEFRVWFNLLCYAADREPRGTIRGVRDSVVRIQAAHGDGVLLNGTIQKLLDMDIISMDDGAITFVHFEERQYDKPSDHPAAIGERVRKHREMKRLVTKSNADVTPSNVERRVEESREEEKRVEKKRTTAQAPRRQLSEGELDKLYLAFPKWSRVEIGERSEEALNHKAAQKAVDLYLYVRNWLRRDYQKLSVAINSGGRDGSMDYESWLPARKQ